MPLEWITLQYHHPLTAESRDHSLQWNCKSISLQCFLTPLSKNLSLPIHCLLAFLSSAVAQSLPKESLLLQTWRSSKLTSNCKSPLRALALVPCKRTHFQYSILCNIFPFWKHAAGSTWCRESFCSWVSWLIPLLTASARLRTFPTMSLRLLWLTLSSRKPDVTNHHFWLPCCGCLDLISLSGSWWLLVEQH